MAIGYYQIQSPLPQLSQSDVDIFLRALSKEIGEPLEPVALEQFIQEDFRLLYVASGGSENFFLQIFQQIKNKPCYLLTSGDSNSLAASMEILSYLQQHGCRGEILHGDLVMIAARIQSLRTAARAVASLAGKSIGMIGVPSDWLIASKHSAEACLKKLSIHTVDISIDELVSEIHKASYTPDQWTDLICRRAFDSNEVEKSLHIYGALQRIAERYQLSAMTVRCFDLLERVHASGCVGLSILNAKGIYGGCEGDVPALLSMMILGEISGKPTFQCNPSRIDRQQHLVRFAHCAVPLNMPDSFELDTHFESKIGVAIAGKIQETACTVFKTSGDLSRYFVTEGHVVSQPYEDMLCRTQVAVDMPDVQYFLTQPIGNHHVICSGQYADAVQEFFAMLPD